MNTDYYDPGAESPASPRAAGAIVHRGVIEAYKDGMATVRVSHDTEGGCATCGAREGCGLAASGGGKPDSTVELPYSQVLRPGQRVEVSLAPHSDWKAILFAFALPVALLMGGLVGGSALRLAQLEIAALSLGCLVLYGLVLFIFRSRLKRTFTMTITSVE